METDITLKRDTTIQIDFTLEMLRDIISDFILEEGVDDLEDLFEDNEPLHEWARANGYTKD